MDYDKEREKLWMKTYLSKIPPSEIVWHKLSDNQPRIREKVFISDGKELAVANLDHGGYWCAEGIEGHEWDWSFEPTHWTEITINLPELQERE